MSDPIIGITTYGQDEQRHFPLPREYVDSVRRAGGLPILIPPGEPRIEKILETVDGLILAGGGDLDPAHYNGNQHESIYMLDAERDTSELILAKTAIENGFPVFGICRGLQVINVALGGSLIEHLPDVVGNEVSHRLPPREPTKHEITVLQESRLAGVLGETQFVAASWHHQAVGKVGEPLTVVAHAPDGTIEAVEMVSHPWLIAVQWHPELTAAQDATQQRLFDTFVKEVTELREARKSAI